MESTKFQLHSSETFSESANEEETIFMTNFYKKVMNDVKLDAEIIGDHPNYTKIIFELGKLPSHNKNIFDHIGYHESLINAPTDLSAFTIQSNLPVLLTSDPILFQLDQKAAKFDETKIVHKAIINASMRQYTTQEGSQMLDVSKLSFIGLQKHLTYASLFELCQNEMINLLRLGDIRSDIQQVEAIFRHAAYIDFNLGAIRKSDLPESNQAPVCGFTIEEACQIARYAGTAPEIKAFNISGINFNIDSESYYHTVSLLLWYFFEGLAIQKRIQAPNQKLVEYIIYPEDSETPFFFYHNPVENRWWFSLESYQNNEKIPCTENDYQMAKNNIFSERISKIIDTH